MNARLFLAFGLLLIAVTASAARPQVEITARYENFDPAFFSGLTDVPPDGLSTPAVKILSGQSATIEIITEIPVFSFTKPERKVNDGVTLELEPEIKEGKIFLAGKGTVRRHETPAAAQPLAAESFTARETLFSGEIEDGQSLTIQTGDGVKDTSRMILTARLVPVEEARFKHLKAPDYSVWSVELPPAEVSAALAKAVGAKKPAAPPDGKDAKLVGVFSPLQTAAVFRELPAKNLKKLPAADWPMTIASTLGPDQETVDLSFRPGEKQPRELSFDCTVYCESSLWVTAADEKQAGGQRTLLIVPQ